MKLLGFKHKQTAKFKICLDAISFQAQHAYYFWNLDELRSANAILYYHGEIWLNKNEEKTVIWFDSQQRGRLHASEGKGEYVLVDQLCSLHYRCTSVFVRSTFSYSWTDKFKRFSSQITGYLQMRWSVHSYKICSIHQTLSMYVTRVL